MGHGEGDGTSNLSRRKVYRMPGPGKQSARDLLTPIICRCKRSGFFFLLREISRQKIENPETFEAPGRLREHTRVNAGEGGEALKARAFGKRPSHAVRQAEIP